MVVTVWVRCGAFSVASLYGEVFPQAITGGTCEIHDLRAVWKAGLWEGGRAQARSPPCL